MFPLEIRDQGNPGIRLLLQDQALQNETDDDIGKMLLLRAIVKTFC